MPTIDNPILNRPFDTPTRHWRLDDKGVPTGLTADGRRPSEYVVPVPPAQHQVTGQGNLELDAETGERRSNDYVNEMRAKVDAWRRVSETTAARSVTPVTAQLLRHWRSQERDRRLFFCQIEAVETIIWLTEVAPRSEIDRLRALNADANPDLLRLALKLATGAGKTTVMGMLIAWHTLNRARSPGSSRFTDAFLVITPGITIKDRLRVLQPSDPANIYVALDLVPPDMRDDLQRARVVITNYHAFQRRETMEAPKLVKSILGGREGPIKTLETEGQMIARVCKDLLGRKQIVVLNDEAHHCYRERASVTAAKRAQKLSAEDSAQAKKSNEAARLWISGIEALQRVTKNRAAIYDLSATPFFLRGSGYDEGELFPWVVSDFSLIDAIEAGIVKVPRVPIHDVPGAEEPVYRHIYKYVRGELPKAGRGKQATTPDPEKLPSQLEGALRALYANYEKIYQEWQAKSGTTPPVFIVVCNNTATSKWVYDFISGFEREEKVGTGETAETRRVIVPGKLPLFSNVADGTTPESRAFLSRPNTILIDSEQLESGEALSGEFRQMAAPEIEAFKRELRSRGRAMDAETLSDADLLREVMNTVGQAGRLGEQIRCVVSVSMLTEGWDARTVTHVVGVRAFGTQLLCEQVIGRALRRVSYDADAEGFFAPEYAEVLGIPFTFVPAGSAADHTPPKQLTTVRAVLPERDALTITFPRVLGYRVVLPPGRLDAHFSAESRLRIEPPVAPPDALLAAIAGENLKLSLDDLKSQRDATVAFHVAGHTLRTWFRDAEGTLKPWLFPQLLAITRRWMAECLTCVGGTSPAYLLLRGEGDKAAEKIHLACVAASGGQKELRPILDTANEVGSSQYVRFATAKTDFWITKPEKCQIDRVVNDSGWEAACAQHLEAMPEVLRYVRNYRLGFEIPYVHAGEDHNYTPDFIAVIDDGAGPDDPLHLVLEVKGRQTPEDDAKHETARKLWVAAVNNAGRFGRWDFLVVRDQYEMPADIRAHLARAPALTE